MNILKTVYIKVRVFFHTIYIAVSSIVFAAISIFAGKIPELLTPILDKTEYLKFFSNNFVLYSVIFTAITALNAKMFKVCLKTEVKDEFIKNELEIKRIRVLREEIKTKDEKITRLQKAVENKNAIISSLEKDSEHQAVMRKYDDFDSGKENTTTAPDRNKGNAVVSYGFSNVMPGYKPK